VTQAAPRRRLTRSADFDAVYRRGRARASRHLVVYVFPPDDLARGDGPRIGITVPKRVGSAVARNRIKRQLREAITAAGLEHVGAADLVVVARPGLAEAIESSGFAWLVAEIATLSTSEPSP
jgi:ribonuclease P protein component